VEHYKGKTNAKFVKYTINVWYVYYTIYSTYVCKYNCNCRLYL